MPARKWLAAGALLAAALSGCAIGPALRVSEAAPGTPRLLPDAPLRVVLDPGFGFGKSLNENHELLQKLEHLHLLGAPLLVGVSRKSMVTKKLNCSPAEALNGTSILQTLAYTKGARIFRVHDIKEVKELILLLAAQDLH